MIDAPQPATGLVKEVLQYFIDHPQVVDTPEGVAMWRLLEQALRREVPLVTEALEWLADRGFLKRTETPGARRLFQLNPDQRDAARQFLEAPLWPPT